MTSSSKALFTPASLAIIICLFVFQSVGDVFFWTIHSALDNTSGCQVEIFSIGTFSFTDWDLIQLFDKATIGFFVGQASLLALWADRCPIKSYIRVSIALLAVVGLCWLMARPWKNLSWLTPADYFYLLGIHASLLIFILFLVRVRKALLERKRSTDAAQQANNVQFSIGFMLIWTTVIAILLGLGKYAISHPNWSPSNNNADYFVEIGVYNTLFALLAFVSILGRRKRWWSVIATLILVELLGWLEGFFIVSNSHYNFPYDNNIDTLCIANVQVLMIFATLLPLRWCGLLNRKES